jgi:hypothetical protein
MIFNKHNNSDSKFSGKSYSGKYFKQKTVLQNEAGFSESSQEQGSQTLPNNSPPPKTVTGVFTDMLQSARAQLSKGIKVRIQSSYPRCD